MPRSFTCLVKRRVVASETPLAGFVVPTSWRPGSGGGGGNRRNLLPDECRRGRASARGARRGAGGNERSRERRAACGACLPAAVRAGTRLSSLAERAQGIRNRRPGGLGGLGLASDRGGGGAVSPGGDIAHRDGPRP